MATDLLVIVNRQKMAKPLPNSPTINIGISDGPAQRQRPVASATDTSMP
jgi:hypothetical protein